MSPPKHVYVIDDDPGARNSLCWLLGTVNLPAKAYESCERFLDEFDEQQGGCVILDLRMPGMNGMGLLEKFATSATMPAVILVTAYGTVATTARAMRFGAIHVLEKPYDDQELLDTVQEGLKIDEQNREKRSQLRLATSRLRLLTPREHEILGMMVAGAANKVIASKLCVSEKNIEYHRTKIYRKLEATCMADLIRMVLMVYESNPNRTRPT